MSNLAYYRKRAGLSQSELAKACDISTRTLQDYEQGVRDINNAKAITVYKMTLALNVSISDILELKNEEAVVSIHAPT